MDETLFKRKGRIEIDDIQEADLLKCAFCGKLKPDGYLLIIKSHGTKENYRGG